MAEIMDVAELGELEAVAVQEPQAQAEQPPELPEKYRGKQVADLVRMHQEAEKLIGRQAQEVGEVRKLADELLKSQLQPKAKVEQPEVDFFENPQEAIRNAVATNPKVIAAEQYIAQTQMDKATQNLNQKHPDMSAIVKDEEFQAWVKSSPIRMQLFQMADGYNVDAADELLSTFKQLRTVRQSRDVEADKSARNGALKAAAVDMGGSGEVGRKVYRRADLIRLKMSDPNKYEAMNDEIMAAYSEGRVK